MCSFRECDVLRTTFITWTWNTTSIPITLVTIIACNTSCPCFHWLTFVTSLPDEGLMTLKDIRTWVLFRLITGIARVDGFDERTIQTVVIQIHSNDVVMLLWLNEWIIINVFRLDSLEKMSWGRDVSKFEYRRWKCECEWDEESWREMGWREFNDVRSSKTPFGKEVSLLLLREWREWECDDEWNEMKRRLKVFGGRYCCRRCLEGGRWVDWNRGSWVKGVKE